MIQIEEEKRINDLVRRNVSDFIPGNCPDDIENFSYMF